jgi:hypothetical protein
MAGAGFVNFGEHAEGELTLLASSRDDRTATPYAGVRVMHVLPMSSIAVRDKPTAGGFIGMRLRFADLDVSPELGVYHDPSALGIRPTSYIVVPGIAVTPRGSRAR